MKKIFFVIAVAGLLMVFSISCKKNWLSPPPENVLVRDDSTFANPANAVKFVNSCYAQLNEWGEHVFSWVGVSSITSDDAEKGSDPGDLGADKDQMDNFTYTATSLSPSEVWSANYAGVGRCNQAIANIPKFSIDQGLKDRLTGEAKFLRAYFYFNLVRCFGGVPKVDKVYNAENINEVASTYQRATKDEIYALIVEDLTEAAAKLPAKSAYSAADVGRASKGAAQGMLAKVQLYQKNWAAALAASDLVINSPDYSLEPDYATLWRQSTENGRESLFEVQAQNGGEGWATGGYFACQGARGTVTGGYGGWGFNVPSADLANAYEAGDVRKAGTIYTAGQTLWDGAVVSATVTNPRYNYKSYVSQTKETNYDDWWTSKNIRILRLGDILLINAEAANELGGQTAKALTSLNKVRARARGGVPGVLPDVVTTDQAQLRTAIWKERRVEMAFEHDRFFDLIRQGRAGAVFQALNKNFVVGKHELFPIPQNQIDISGGLLKQNPGY